ncbi:MAG: PAS domain S-box protein [Sulfuricella denitrificans]|nr:PAS domain S-box protein [Sulfuricella denitrificans]
MNVFAPAARKNLVPYLPLLVYGLFACLIAVAGYQVFHKIENLIEVEKLHDLGAIADVKVGQVVSWQNGHKRRVSAFSTSSALVAEFNRWLNSGATSDELEERILRMLAGLQLSHGYVQASLLDREGMVRITTGTDEKPDATEEKLVVEAMNSRRPVFADLHRSSHENRAIILSMASPLIDADNGNGRVVGAVLLQIDPYDYFYPLVQLWPRDSPSAETLLIRKEGDEVVFLNELRHQKGTALSLRIPVSNSDLPAAMATRGEVNTMNGVDYRGVPVVAAMREVPGTSWHMVAKVDKDELFASIFQIKWWAAGLGLGLAILGGAFFFVWLQGFYARQRQLRAERDAAQQREMRVRYFEYLTRYANDMIIVFNEDGRIVEANEKAQQALGYSREELLQINIVALHDPHESQAVADKLGMLKMEGECRMEGRFQRKDGSIFPVEVSARVIEVQGVRFMQSIIRDFTEHKQLEEMRAKIEHAGRLNIAGEMASGMAHELSQPLTACNNYLDVCLRRMDEEAWGQEKLRSTLKLAAAQAERAGNIVSHLREMVRQNGHERALTDVKQLIRDVMSLLESELKRSGITVHMTLSPTPPMMICRVEIEQVLFNLCRNAIEAMHSWPQRDLRISSRLNESGDVLISVSDSGKGVMAAERVNLFNPFHSTKKDGLGLGLVICRSIVESHGGRIWVDEDREFGAEFCFTLPLGADHE